MPKKRATTMEHFGGRLAALRQAAGYNQVELAAELGISQRRLASYESPRAHPPVALLLALARTLGLSVEQLLGSAAPPAPSRARPRDTRLWRRFAQIEKFSPTARKPIIQVLDAFLAKAKLTTDDKRRI